MRRLRIDTASGNEFCEFKLRNKPVHFDEMEREEQDAFIEAHKAENTGCLLEHIKTIHFDNYNYGKEKKITAVSVEGLREAVQRYFK